MKNANEIGSIFYSSFVIHHKLIILSTGRGRQKGDRCSGTKYKDCGLGLICTKNYLEEAETCKKSNVIMLIIAWKIFFNTIIFLQLGRIST